MGKGENNLAKVQGNEEVRLYGNGLYDNINNIAAYRDIGDKPTVYYVNVDKELNMVRLGSIVQEDRDGLMAGRDEIIQMSFDDLGISFNEENRGEVLTTTNLVNKYLEKRNQDRGYNTVYLSEVNDNQEKRNELANVAKDFPEIAPHRSTAIAKKVLCKLKPYIHKPDEVLEKKRIEILDEVRSDVIKSNEKFIEAIKYNTIDIEINNSRFDIMLYNAEELVLKGMEYLKDKNQGGKIVEHEDLISVIDAILVLANDVTLSEESKRKLNRPSEKKAKETNLEEIRRMSTNVSDEKNDQSIKDNQNKRGNKQKR